MQRTVVRFPETACQDASEAALAIDTEDHKAWYRSAELEGITVHWKLKSGPGKCKQRRVWADSKRPWTAAVCCRLEVVVKAEDSLAKLEDVAQWCRALGSSFSEMRSRRTAAHALEAQTGGASCETVRRSGRGRAGGKPAMPDAARRCPTLPGSSAWTGSRWRE